MENFDRFLVVFDFEGKDTTEVVQSYFANPQDFDVRLVEEYNFWYNLYAYDLARIGIEILPFSTYKTLDNIPKGLDRYVSINTPYKKVIVISSKSVKEVHNLVKIGKESKTDMLVDEFTILDKTLLKHKTVSIEQGYLPIATDTKADTIKYKDKVYNFSMVINAVSKQIVQALVDSKLDYNLIIKIRLGLILFFLNGLYNKGEGEKDTSRRYYIGRDGGPLEVDCIQAYYRQFLYNVVMPNFKDESSIKENLIDLPVEQKVTINNALTSLLDKAKEEKDSISIISIELAQALMGI